MCVYYMGKVKESRGRGSMWQGSGARVTTDVVGERGQRDGGDGAGAKLRRIRPWQADLAGGGQTRPPAAVFFLKKIWSDSPD